MKEIMDLVTVRTEDIEDIGKTLKGDGEAYARLVERYQAAIADRMWRFTRDKTHHEELIQDVFVEAFANLKTFRGEAPFGHWLARIATRVGYRFWKRRTRERSRQVVLIEDWDQLPIEEPEQIDPSKAGEILEALLNQLAPRDRLVLMLRYVENRSVEETADQTGWTQTMVKVQSWRARKRLKKLFDAKLL